MLPLFTKPIDAIDRSDVEELIQQALPEGVLVEYKRALPHKGEGQDPWYSGSDQIKEYARNQLLEEIVAFANGYGGHLLLGIEESTSRPPVAKDFCLIPRCAELADKLSLQARDCIDPQVPSLDAKGIVMNEDGAGIVTIRVPRSLAAPHRMKPTCKAYMRRGERADEMDMREIQELTLSRARETDLIRAKLVQRSEAFRREARKFSERSGQESYALRVTLVPLHTELRTGILRDDFFKDHYFQESQLLLNESILSLNLPALYLKNRPILRGIRYADEQQTMAFRCDICEDGVVDYWLLDGTSVSDPSVVMPLDWPIGLALNALLTADRVRTIAGSPGVGYIVEPELMRYPDGSILIGNFGAHYDPMKRGGLIPESTIYPQLSFGPRQELSRVLEVFHRDIWNSAGRPAPRFPLSLLGDDPRQG